MQHNGEHARAPEPAAQLWQELSTALRESRAKAGLSLRAVERMTGWGRGSLSQIENGKARPTRAQTEWYDEEFDGDGMFVSLFAEARGAYGPAGRGAAVEAVRDGDAVEVLAAVLPLANVVRTGSSVTAGWTLRNAGTVPWRDRRLRRVGPAAGRGLLAGPSRVDLPACEPGGQVSVGFEIAVPDVAATLAACWEIVDEQDRRCHPASFLLRVVLVGREGL